MKKILMLVMVVVCLKANAQKYKLSNEPVDDAGYEYIKVIGQNEEGFYLLQSNLSLNSERDRIGFRNRKYKLACYDFNMNLKWSHKLEDGNNSGIDVVTVFNDQPLILRSQWQRAENKVSFTLEVLDEKGNSVSVKNAGSISCSKDGDLEKARLILSRNNVSGCILLQELLSNTQVMHVIPFDTSLNASTALHPVINYDIKDLEITDLACSDNGDVAVLSEQEERSPDEKRKKILKYRFFLMRKGSSSFTENEVSYSGIQLTEASLTIDNLNNKVVVAGFYNDNDSYTGTGILFASWQLNNSTDPEIKKITIDGNDRIKLIGERNSGASSGIYTYPIRKLILRSDGGAVVIAEAAYYTEYSYYDYFTQSFNRRIEYHFDNVVVMSVHADGNVDWSTVLRKTQESIDDGGAFSSFSTVLQSHRIDLIYNKDLSRNNAVGVFTVDNKGISDLSNLSSSETGLYILPQSGKQVDENTLIIGAIQKKKLYLLKAEF